MSAIDYNKRQGYSTETVAHIQRTVGANPDGTWGKETVRQVRGWQAQQGLPADGKVGPETLRHFEAVWAQDAAPVGDEHLDDRARDEPLPATEEPLPDLEPGTVTVVDSYEEGYDYFDRDRDLARGDKGDDVVALQNDLFAFGFDGGKPDGTLGKNGVAAITAFQDACATPHRIGGHRRIEVPVTYESSTRGVVDAATRAEIKRWKENGWRYLAPGRDHVERRVRVDRLGVLPGSSALLRDVAAVKGRRRLHRLAAEAFEAMSQAAVADGQVELAVISAWRAHRWESKAQYEATMIKEYGSVSRGRRYKAYSSPHETGLAVDIGVGGLWPDSKTANKQREQPLHQWLVANAYRFGWHPYLPEPWHWEFPLSLRAWTLGLQDWRLKAEG